MKRNMRIGSIGTENIGATLTRHFTRLEHDVVVANSRGPETLVDLAKETGAKPGSVAEVPRGCDLVVVTIPEGKIPNLILHASDILAVILSAKRSQVA
jgi:predicted dinucleotide-binding enzyme